MRLASVGSNELLSNGKYISHLPPAWGTLYNLTRLLSNGKFTTHLPPSWLTLYNLTRLLSNGAHVHHLPPSWRTLYELTRLADAAMVSARTKARAGQGARTDVDGTSRNMPRSLSYAQYAARPTKELVNIDRLSYRQYAAHRGRVLLIVAIPLSPRRRSA